jgi:hypothetical protein
MEHGALRLVGPHPFRSFLHFQVFYMEVTGLIIAIWKFNRISLWWRLKMIFD